MRKKIICLFAFIFSMIIGLHSVNEAYSCSVPWPYNRWIVQPPYTGMTFAIGHYNYHFCPGNEYAAVSCCAGYVLCWEILGDWLQIYVGQPPDPCEDYKVYDFIAVF